MRYITSYTNDDIETISSILSGNCSRNSSQVKKQQKQEHHARDLPVYAREREGRAYIGGCKAGACLVSRVISVFINTGLEAQSNYCQKYVTARLVPSPQTSLHYFLSRPPLPIPDIK